MGEFAHKKLYNRDDVIAFLEEKFLRVLIIK